MRQETVWYTRRRLDLAHVRMSAAEAGRSGTGLYSRCCTVGLNVNDANAWMHFDDTERLVGPLSQGRLRALIQKCRSVESETALRTDARISEVAK